MVFIYILKLQQGKYYVGKTTSPSFRLESHFNANGSAWTKKYAPIKLLELIPDCDDYDEDKYTKIYMDRYGVDNVRGGSYVQVKLDEATISHLSQMSNGTNDKCFTCGKSGHFARDCNKEVQKVIMEETDTTFKNDPWTLKEHIQIKKLYNENMLDIIEISKIHNRSPDQILYSLMKTNCIVNSQSARGYTSSIKKVEEVVIWCCSHCDREFESKRSALDHESRCNKSKPDGKCDCPSSYFSPHRKSRCFLKRMIEESEDDDDDDDDSDDESEDEEMQCCYRCGRQGHYANTCYASKHVKGYYLK